MKLEITWHVEGTSVVELSDDDMRRAMREGVDPDDWDQVYEWARKAYPAKFGHALVDDFDEMDRPVVNQVMAYGGYPEPEDGA